MKVFVVLLVAGLVVLAAVASDRSGGSTTPEQPALASAPAPSGVASLNTLLANVLPPARPPATEATDKIIHATVRLPCNARRAFRMFTEGDLLRTWLADAAEVEPKVGGQFYLRWDQKAVPNHGTQGCRITAMEPDKLLAFQWRGPDRFDDTMNRGDPLTHVTVSFLPCDEANAAPCTEVHLIHSGWAHGQGWDQARAWFERAWNLAFDALLKQLNAR